MNSLYEPVAQGLSEDGFAVVDGFLSLPEVDAIRRLDEFRSGLLHFSKAGTGSLQSRMVNEEIRGDYVRWIDHRHVGPELKVYFNRLNDMMVSLRESLFLSLKDVEVHLTIYPAGTFYKRHIDQFVRDDHRRLSVILYLNEDWREEQGGQLRLHMPAGPVDVFPLGGRLICFRSDQVEHEVLPAIRERLSITGWILDRLVELKHL